ncbi:hypothetical protein [Amnibacterium kyonggiense]
MSLDLAPHVGAIPRSPATGRPDLREHRYRLRATEEDPYPRRLALPAPRALAEAIAAALAPSRVHRDDTALVVLGDAGPEPLDVQAVRAATLASLARLQPGTGYYTGDLAELARREPAALDPLLDRALAFLVRPGVLPPVPRERAPRPAPLTPGERKAASRADLAAREAESVAAFLAEYLALDDAPQPGDRVGVSVLRDAAADWIEEAVEALEDTEVTRARWEEDLAVHENREAVRKRAMERRASSIPPEIPHPRENRRTYPREPDTWEDLMDLEGYPPRPRLPGARRLSTLLAARLNGRHHGRDGDFYVIPEPSSTEQEAAPMNPEILWETAVAQREVTDARRADVAAIDAQAEALQRLYAIQRERLDAGDRAGALHSQRERLAATGTDGAPVDLAAYRQGHR